MVPSVLDARNRGVLQTHPMFQHLTRERIAWENGRTEPVDAIIWCTGFGFDLRHLAPLDLSHDATGIPRTNGSRSLDEPRLHFLGYGDWTGAASATIIGAARTAKPCIVEILSRLNDTVS
jgi:putative flavoprotein involved in K+ transport